MSLPIDTGDVLTKDCVEYKRVRALREQIIHAVPHVCIERARIITEFYRNNRALSPIELKNSFFQICSW